MSKKLVSKEDQEKLAEAFGKDGQLTPEMEAAFDKIVARLKKRRRIYIWGYGGAILSILIGAPAGLYYMALAPHERRGWVLIIPLLLSSLLLYFCGRAARRT